MNPVLRAKLMAVLKYVVPGIFVGAMALGMFSAPPPPLVGASADWFLAKVKETLEKWA